MRALDPQDELHAFLAKMGVSIARGAQSPAPGAAGKALATMSSGPMQSDAWDLLAQCGDGDRTEHLTRLAGWYYTRSFSQEQVIAHCLKWNATNTPPLSDDKVTYTCKSIGATDARNHPNRGALSPSATGPVTPLFDLAQAAIGNYLTTPPPPRRWVLDNFLPLGIVGAIVSPGGTGKSQFLMQLAYSVATGVPLAGHWTVSEPGTVLMLCAEDGPDEVHRRVHKIHQQLGLAFDAKARKQLVDRLFIRSVVGEDVLMTSVVGNNEAVKTNLIDRLALTVKQVADLKLIIVDPASRFRGGDENSNLHATRFVQALEALAQQTSATVLIAHHTNKASSYGGDASQNSSRGASALTDGLRLQLALTPTPRSKVAGESNTPSVLQLSVVKTNYTATPPPVGLTREADGYLQAAKGSTATMAADAQMLVKLLRLISRTPGLTARTVEDSYCGKGKPLEISQRECRALITSAREQLTLEGKRGKPLQLSAAGRNVLAGCQSLLVSLEKMNATDAACRAGTARQRRTPHTKP